MDRANFLAGALSAGASSGFATSPFSVLEARFGGRLGVAALNTRTGIHLAHRGTEIFPMCSTFKVLAVATVLARVDRGRERLTRPVRYSQRDLLDYAPVAKKHLRDGSLSVEALCKAALAYSDNTAANLLLRSVGGPPAVTAFARSIGDDVTRLDRTEPTLNTAIPGDLRDTTTPNAMLATLRELFFGNALSRNARGELDGWMTQCKTGDRLLRAGVPHDWRVADKTGSGDNGTQNDIGVIFPPHDAPPIIVTAYYTGSPASPEMRDRVIAHVGRVASLRLV